MMWKTNRYAQASALPAIAAALALTSTPVWSQDTQPAATSSEPSVSAPASTVDPVPVSIDPVVTTTPAPEAAPVAAKLAEGLEQVERKPVVIAEPERIEPERRYEPSYFDCTVMSCAPSPRRYYEWTYDRTCRYCGTTVFHTEVGSDKSVSVAVGAFADPQFPAPKVSVYDCRRHPWVQVPPGTKAFDKDPP